MILHSSDSILLTDDAGQKISEYNRVRKALGLKAIAFVSLKDKEVQLFKDIIEIDWQEIGVPCQFFANLREAEQWVNVN